MINLGAKNKLTPWSFWASKMRPNTLEYVYMVILLVKKDESHRFCGDYRPLNMQTH